MAPTDAGTMAGTHDEWAEGMWRTGDREKFQSVGQPAGLAQEPAL